MCIDPLYLYTYINLCTDLFFIKLFTDLVITYELVFSLFMHYCI